MSNRDIEGVVLAAGESRRMGYPKPLLGIGGTTFIEHIARAMLEVVPRIIVVVGAHGERVRAAIPCGPGIVVAENVDYARGQLSSLNKGIASIRETCTAALVHLGDQPMVQRATWRALIGEYRKSRAPIVIGRYRGKRGHPVIFGRSVFAELAAAPDDQGARFVVNSDPARVRYVDLDDPGIVLDLDTPDDLCRAGLAPPPTAARPPNVL